MERNLFENIVNNFSLSQKSISDYNNSGERKWNLYSAKSTNTF
jgi:hypothetical protein